MSIKVNIFQEKEVIFRQGDRGNWMFDILQGKVGIYTEYGTENQVELVVLEPGQFFGEMGLIEHLPRSATAVALENDTQLQKIDDEAFMQYFIDKPDKTISIMQHMSFRIRALTADYLNACRALNDTVEAELDEKKKAGFKARFKKFLDDHFSFANTPYYSEDGVYRNDFFGARREWGLFHDNSDDSYYY